VVRFERDDSASASRTPILKRLKGKVAGRGDDRFRKRSRRGRKRRGGLSAEFADVVYVLHCLQKKAKRGIGTPKLDTNVIERRLKWANGRDLCTEEVHHDRS